MQILELKGKLPNEIVESITARGINSFTPPQELSFQNGVLEGRNLVIASPTASGKTLIAEIACVNNIIRNRRKSIYIAPMRALVSEKYEEFRSSYPYIKSAISIGDLDSTDMWLHDYDMIFASTEKFDSLIRHGADWINDIGCVVFDEIHMLDDVSRGPTLEILITKIKERSNVQIIALSATIGNANELAEWINAGLVESDFRPVKLKKGIMFENEIYYEKSIDAKKKSGRTKKADLWEKESLAADARIPENMIVEDTLSRGKQIIIFYSSRRNAENGANRISMNVSARLTAEEKKELEKLGDKVLNALGSPTEQCKKLSALVKKGAAFHHAGLLNSQRTMIEEAFKHNLLKAVCATTTLSVGINMPAHTVLVKDIYRYDGAGSSMLKTNDVMQLFGRAGRPSYDTEGRALMIASNKEQFDRIYLNYINARLEPIDSSIGILPVLRSHILSFVAESFLNSEDSINGFLMRTFYGHQYRSMQSIKANVSAIIRELKEWEFIYERDGILLPTRLGARISQLYIDPLSAKWIVDSLGRKRDLIGNLFMITNTLEMRPYVKANEEALAQYVMHREMFFEKKIFRDYESLDYGLYEPEKAFATALMLKEWIDEVRENALVDKYSTNPGTLYLKVTNADWLLYSSIEIAKLLHISTHDLTSISIRMKYGIKEELLDLVRLEQVGRVRARMLFNNGIKSVSEVRENRDKVIRILGKEIADRVLKQLD